MISSKVYHKLHNLKQKCTKGRWQELRRIAELCLRKDNIFGYKECVRVSSGTITTADRHLLKSFDTE